ncbi:MAG TPA: ABC transporter ATP-binding protein [Mycobacteriales bacterium]|jgi:peptide/nickel transport system ATP-binding protein|nr:ABC transporter ATP-binding protein [Mycobacteriales bacterium]
MLTATRPTPPIEEAPTPSVPALEVKDLHITFPGGVQALRGVDLTVGRGEVVGLVGESGSGKTVLGLAALGLLPTKAIVTGTAALSGIDMVGAPEEVRRQARRDHAGAVFQDPMTSLNPTMRIGRQVAEASGSIESAIDLLDRAGIPDPQRRIKQYPHELSGGLRQRVMIAMAIAGSPDLVVADEPTTALDVTVQSQILNLFRELRDATTSFIFVTHDLAVAREVADRIVVLYGGRVAEIGPTEDVLRAPTHPYTAALLHARLGRHSRRGEPLPTLPGEPPDPRHPAEGCAFAARCSHAEEKCTTALPVLEVTSPTRSVACVRRDEIGAHVTKLRVIESWPAAPEFTSELALQMRGITKAFGRGSARRVAVDALDLDVRKGSCVALVGESGCGKTTTLRMAVGLEKPDDGTVETGRGNPPQLVFQDAGASLTPWLRIGDLMEEPLRNAGLPAKERGQRVKDTLALVGLPDAVADARGAELSGGQRQRVALARAVLIPPTLLACDEPISALDVSLAAVVLNLLGRLSRELGMAMLFVTHDLGAARFVSDEIAVMAGGIVVERGATEEVLAAPTNDATRELLAAVPDFEAAR